jgi:hypothetical protein
LKPFRNLEYGTWTLVVEAQLFIHQELLFEKLHGEDELGNK